MAADWARGAERLVRSCGRQFRRIFHAQGAGASGLGQLIETHAVNAIGDALVALALAGTLFFNVPVGEARSGVALYLVITMAPFALMAPLIGPALDRLRHGRRLALAATFAGRAALCWSLAGAVVSNDAVQLYPSAFGILVLSKAYGVTRASAVPRLLPPGIGLVKANARLNLAGIVFGISAAGVGSAVTALSSPGWTLRLAVLVFAVGAVVAARLPRQVDYVEGEEPVSLTGAHLHLPHLPHRHHRGEEPRRETTTEPTHPAGKNPARLRNVGPEVTLGLRANGGLRAFSGFLIFFLAFLLRTDPVGGLDPAIGTAVVAGSAAVGSGLAITLGAWLRDRPPEGIVLAVVGAAAAACVLASWLYGIVAVGLVALVAGLAQSLGKLSLDAMIQEGIPERVRTSVFARSETLLQLCWVIGAGIGTALPLRGDLGLGLAALMLLAVLVSVAHAWHRLHQRGSLARRPAGRSVPRSGR